MASRNTLHVEVVTAERELYSGEADLVSAPGSEGRLGILPRHAALLTTLAPGELRIRLGGTEEPLFVSGGFVERVACPTFSPRSHRQYKIASATDSPQAVCLYGRTNSRSMSEPGASSPRP